ncbi:hypothetical protein J7L02_03410 [Candidatus Woesearchaeota archaeon]|nr:hypothetical protein [Candidatus Woesearchaeota archaeon]
MLQLRKKRFAQVSMEYLIVVTVAIVLIIPGIYLFYVYTKFHEQAATSRSLYEIGSKIVSAASLVAANGEPARTTLEVELPKTFKQAFILNHEELVFQYDSYNGVSEVVFFSPDNITTNDCRSSPGGVRCNLDLEVGYNKIRIEAIANNVKISKVS